MRRVCPQETQCESHCVLSAKKEPVAIGALERFVADWEAEHPEQGSRDSVSASVKGPGVKVAVVGAGPAGLTASADLAKYGYKVTLFESLTSSGGVLRYGIPEFRLPKIILDRETDYIRSLGVEIKYNNLSAGL
jgi:glutamate synthase (NADPH/NADH) small chain